MLIIAAIAIGLLYAGAFFLLQAKSIIRILFGLLLLGHAANLLIFTAGGIVRARPAIVPPGDAAPPPGAADPIPQALILTAIVISFAVLAFAAVLIKRAYAELGTDRLERLPDTDA
jgi:multicomponent Na+:H+ antiporter subunit C